MSSPESMIEGKEHVDCSKDVHANFNDSSAASTDKANRLESAKKLDGAKSSNAGKEKTGWALISNGMDSDKDLVVSSTEKKDEDESGTELVEWNKDSCVGVEVGVNDIADSTNTNDTCKFGKCWRGRKRKNVVSPKKGDDIIREGVKEEGRGSPLSSYGHDTLKNSVVSSLEIKVEERSAPELVGCSKDADSGDEVCASADGDANVNLDTDKITHKSGKGRRGRKRKKPESSKCTGDDEDGRNKARDGKLQVIGRVLRSRTMAMRGGEKVVNSGTSAGKVGDKRKKETDQLHKKWFDTENDESSRSFGMPRKKLKRPRGRPPKVQGEIGASEVICKEKLKVSGSKKSRVCQKAEDITKGSKFLKARRKNGELKVISDRKHKVMGPNKNKDQPNTENTVKGSSFADGRHNSPSHSHHVGMSSLGKQLNPRKLNKKGELGRRQQQQLVRELIIDILKKAGWTIEYRPRQSRVYNDAVYVDREGKTHWSVTLAYMKLKKKVEDGVADSRTISAFTPIPEEMLSKIKVKRVKERDKKAKQPGQGGSKANQGIPGKDSSKNKPATKCTDGSKRKEKPNSCLRVYNKSSHIKMKGDTSHCEQYNSAGPSRRVKQRLNRGERHNRKPCALLARRSEKGLDPAIDGFIPSNGKCSLLSWLIDLGTVQPGGTVQYMNHSETRVNLEGRISRDGIHCGCCSEILTISDFESHAGSELCQPFYNIYLETGISLLRCLVDSWSKQEESDRIGFHFVDVDGDDPNDDTCNTCGDGGDLICCDGCPSTFHPDCLDIEKSPSGDWKCVYCSCKFCGTVAGNCSLRNDNNDTNVSELLSCGLCGEKFHKQGKDAINVNSNCLSFCGSKCQELYEQLQVLLGVKHELEEGFSWTLLQRSDVSGDISLDGALLKVECNCKLAVAFCIMDECFLPIVDQRSGINMIHNVVYSCGSNFSRLNFSGFFTAILERGDEIISAASIRIHGNQLAEMPFIGTRNIYRRQGMCRRLLNAIESALCILDVEKLVIPAISELFQTWTSVFGFERFEESKRQEMRCMSMIVFPGIDMLQKLLIKNQFGNGNMNPAADVKFTALKTDHQTMHVGTINSDMGASAGSDSIGSPNVIVEHALGVTDETAAVESALHLPDGSLNDTCDIKSGTVNLRGSVANDPYTHLAHLSVTHDNKDVMDSESSACEAPELDVQQTPDGRLANAQSGFIPVLPDERTVECNTKLNCHSISKVESKSFTVPQIGSDATHSEGKTIPEMEEGKEALDGERTDLVHGFQVSVKNFVCQVSKATSPMSSDEKYKIQSHDNSHSLMVHATSPSHKNAANDSYDGNPYSSCPMDVLGTHDHEAVASVDSTQLPFSGAFPLATTGPDSKASFICYGLCKSLELQSVVDSDDNPGVKSSSLTCPVGVSREICCEGTGNNIHDLKEDFTAAQTEFHSLDEDSPPNRFQLCFKSSKQSKYWSPADHTSVSLCGTGPLCNSFL